MNRPALARFAWGTLGYNVAVILWGAWVRVTGSGAGCGSHWPMCNGVVLPRDASTQTLIEFSHRLTSGLSLVLTVLLFAWAWRTTRPGEPLRRAAAWSLGLLLVEALLGAGLVLFRLVEHDESMFRVVAQSTHLLNTLLLLTALSLTAVHASGGPAVSWRTLEGGLGWCLVALGVVAVSGGVAALGDTLHPAQSLAQGLAQDVSGVGPLLTRVRVFHPILAVLTGLFVFGAAYGQRSDTASPRVRSRAGAVCALVLAQCGLGAINVALLAPSALQILHLLVADLLWISVVLLGAETVAAARGTPAADASVSKADAAALEAR